MKFRRVAILVLFLFLWLAAPCAARDKGYTRVVSLMPSVTEIIYALGAEDKLVGVTRYCVYPPQAQEKTWIGGLLDVNYEVLLGLDPDLVFLQVDETEQISRFRKMGLNVVGVETRRLDAILDSILMIGKFLDEPGKAQEIAGRIEQAMEDVNQKTAGLGRPRVLITFLRPVGEGAIREVYIAGTHTFFNDILEAVGAVNAYQGTEMVTSPIVSPEGILRMNPDIIIEVMSSDLEAKFSEEVIRADWDMLPQLDAYKNNKIFILKQPYLGIPGPRMGQTILDFARIIHPEADWN